MPRFHSDLSLVFCENHIPLTRGYAGRYCAHCTRFPTRASAKAFPHAAGTTAYSLWQPFSVATLSQVLVLLLKGLR